MKVLNTGYNIGSNRYTPNFQGDINIAYKKKNSKIRKRTVQGNDDYKIYDYATTNLFNNDLTTRTVNIPTETLKAYTDRIKSVSWLEMPLPNKETTKVELSYNKDDIKTEYTIKTDKFEITHEFDNKELEVQEILNRSLKFGPEEYRSLSKDDLKVLRSYKKTFCEEHGEYVDWATTIGNLYSKRLQEEYPNGFTFVCVGRSPALIAKYMEFQGVNVKYCPISSIRGEDVEFEPDFIKSYKKYLDSIGLTKETAENSPVPIIISDYTCYGNSLINFKNLLAFPEIGIKEGEKVKYRPLTSGEQWSHRSAIFKCNPLDDFDCECSEPTFPQADFERHMIHESNKTKMFASVPKLYTYTAEYELNKYFKNGNQFEESFEAKMMNFCIAEYLNKKEQTFADLDR